MVLFGALRTSAQRAARASTVAGLAFAAVPGAASSVRCDGGSSFGGMKIPSSFEAMIPVGQTLSVGGVLGLCSGFIMKKVGKAAAGIVGGIFVLQQGLAYQGYITVNWNKVEQDMIRVLDVNGDGKFDQKDMESGYLKTLSVLQQNTAGMSGGFAGGFLLGVRYG
eukprot:TRINITY_DN65585_c0_g1_i1.p1 TRINITY_DN65585_c0_g1~~TRINITY_DN65585_c0_g1_i1.p1  ORF type:complete len:181 (+),score=53.42 TRINITY_DN65585_c0_g1_i1:51-545(+)